MEDKIQTLNDILKKYEIPKEPKEREEQKIMGKVKKELEKFIINNNITNSFEKKYFINFILKNYLERKDIEKNIDFAGLREKVKAASWKEALTEINVENKKTLEQFMQWQGYDIYSDDILLIPLSNYLKNRDVKERIYSMNGFTKISYFFDDIRDRDTKLEALIPIVDSENKNALEVFLKNAKYNEKECENLIAFIQKKKLQDLKAYSSLKELYHAAKNQQLWEKKLLPKLEELEKLEKTKKEELKKLEKTKKETLEKLEAIKNIEDNQEKLIEYITDIIPNDIEKIALKFFIYDYLYEEKSFEEYNNLEALREMVKESYWEVILINSHKTIFDDKNQSDEKDLQNFIESFLEWKGFNTSLLLDPLMYYMKSTPTHYLKHDLDAYTEVKERLERYKDDTADVDLMFFDYVTERVMLEYLVHSIKKEGNITTEDHLNYFFDAYNFNADAGMRKALFYYISNRKKDYILQKIENYKTNFVSLFYYIADNSFTEELHYILNSERNLIGETLKAFLKRTIKNKEAYEATLSFIKNNTQNDNSNGELRYKVIQSKGQEVLTAILSADPLEEERLKEWIDWISEDGGMYELSDPDGNNTLYYYIMNNLEEVKKDSYFVKNISENQAFQEKILARGPLEELLYNSRQGELRDEKEAYIKTLLQPQLRDEKELKQVVSFIMKAPELQKYTTLAQLVEAAEQEQKNAKIKEFKNLKNKTYFSKEKLKEFLTNSLPVESSTYYLENRTPEQLQADLEKYTTFQAYCNAIECRTTLEELSYVIHHSKDFLEKPFSIDHFLEEKVFGEAERKDLRNFIDTNRSNLNIDKYNTFYEVRQHVFLDSLIAEVAKEEATEASLNTFLEERDATLEPETIDSLKTYIANRSNRPEEKQPLLAELKRFQSIDAFMAEKNIRKRAPLERLVYDLQHDKDFDFESHLEGCTLNMPVATVELDCLKKNMSNYINAYKGNAYELLAFYSLKSFLKEAEKKKYKHPNPNIEYHYFMPNPLSKASNSFKNNSMKSLNTKKKNGSRKIRSMSKS